MKVSISSIFITLCMSLLLILFLQILLTKKRNYRFFRTDFLSMLVLIILLRICLPFEFFFTKTIPAGIIMNPIMDALNYEFYPNFHIYHILLFLWIFGSTIQIIRYIKYFFMLRKLKVLLEKDVIKTTYSNLCTCRPTNDYPVWISPYVSSPMVMGHYKIIFLPVISFSKKELQHILAHEISHIEYHDFFIKQVIHVLTILYWWFLPIYLLKSEINLFLEIRVDSTVTKKMSSNEYMEYVENLIHISRKIQDRPTQTIPSKLANHFITDHAHILSYRINYLLETSFKRKTNKLLLLCLILVPLLSNSIIFEAYYPDAPLVEGTWSEKDLKNGYIIQHKDGTYSVYIKDKSYTVDKIDYDIFSNLPMYSE